ncbi:MAG TPA: hypothetical protein VFF67_09330 [Thermoplasmata archaeon]|nr:hypothetical protein [Thermoplasmata archaeon]
MSDLVSARIFGMEPSGRVGGALTLWTGVACVTLLLMASAGSAVGASFGVKLGAPYHGSHRGSLQVFQIGCGIARLVQRPHFNMTTGTGGLALSSVAKWCRSGAIPPDYRSIASTSAEIDLGLPFTVATARIHNLSANWSVLQSWGELLTSSTCAPSNASTYWCYQSSTVSEEISAAIHDLTNNTWITGKYVGGRLTGYYSMYNQTVYDVACTNTSGCSTQSYGGGGSGSGLTNVTISLTGYLVPKHQYLFAIYFVGAASVDLESYATKMASLSAGNAYLDVATPAHYATLNSVVVK